MSEEKKRHVVRLTWTATRQALITVEAADENHACRVARHQAPHSLHLFGDHMIQEEDGLTAEHCTCLDDTTDEPLDDEPVYKQYVDCPKCDNCDELPVDEQRHHMKKFTHVENLDYAMGYHGCALYRCNECGCPAISEIKEKD